MPRQRGWLTKHQPTYAPLNAEDWTKVLSLPLSKTDRNTLERLKSRQRNIVLISSLWGTMGGGSQAKKRINDLLVNHRLPYQLETLDARHFENNLSESAIRIGKQLKPHSKSG